VEDGDNAITEIPDEYHPVLFYAAAKILWMHLGQPDEAIPYEALYREALRDMEDMRLRASGPMFARLAPPSRAATPVSTITTTG